MTNSLRSITTLLFDWDGTLADSARLGLEAFQRAFEELGVPFSQDVYETTYSPNWYSIYEGLGLPRENWQRADDLWLKHYGDKTAGLVEGVKETVLELRHRVFAWGSSAAAPRAGYFARLNRPVWPGALPS